MAEVKPLWFKAPRGKWWHRESLTKWTGGQEPAKLRRKIVLHTAPPVGDCSSEPGEFVWHECEIRKTKPPDDECCRRCLAAHKRKGKTNA